MSLILANEIEYLRTGGELPHALLLEGPVGCGLHTLAIHLAGNELSGEIVPTDTKGEIDLSSSGVIRVTQIRELLSQASNKSRSRRVYIIDNADQMNHQAQNAFLKLLEEPAQHVRFILTSHHSEQLLPTTLSRLQIVRVPLISRDASHELLDSLGVIDITKRTQLLFLGEGLPAELSRLVNDSRDFEHKAAVMSAARLFLQGSMAEKLLTLNSYAKDRSGALEMLTYAQHIIRHSLTTHPSNDLIRRANQLSEAYDRIAANGHIRIQLAGLVV